MGYQFFHVELYARSASKLAGKKRVKKGQVRETDGIHKNWSAREILAEALREVGSCDHVDTPLPPEVLFGDLRKLADELDHSEPPKGQRKDTPIMMAGVASAPWPPGDPRSKAWRDDTVDHLRRRFGDALRAVIGHCDEDYDHLHFYVCAPGLSPVKGLHPGQAARAKSAAEGADGKGQIEAYNAAMKGWQDEYGQEVAQRHGQTRIGPKRQRVGRMEWMEQKRAAEFHARQVYEVEKRLADVQQAESVAAMKQQAQAASIEVQRAELERRRQVLEAKAEKIQAQRVRLVEWAKEVDVKDKRVTWMMDKITEALTLLPLTFADKLRALFGVPAPTPPPTLKKPPVGVSGALPEVSAGDEQSSKSMTPHRGLPKAGL